MKRTCAVLVVVVAVLGSVWAQSVEEQIKKLETDRAAAVVKGDADLLAKATADTYTLVNASGAMSDKTQMLEQIKSGQIKLQSDDLSDMKVQVYGNTAVSYGKGFGKGSCRWQRHQRYRRVYQGVGEEGREVADGRVSADEGGMILVEGRETGAWKPARARL